MSTADLDQPIRNALANGGVIDITTTGRKSGEPHRIEIVFHNIGGRLYVSACRVSSEATSPTSRLTRT